MKECWIKNLTSERWVYRCFSNQTEIVIEPGLEIEVLKRYGLNYIDLAKFYPELLSGIISLRDERFNSLTPEKFRSWFPWVELYEREEINV